MEFIKKIREQINRLINNISSRYYSLTYEKINCPKEYHGTEYGGWSICPLNITKDSIVYSFGIGEDISFDLSLIKKFGIKIYAFDPTPRAIKWVKSQKVIKNFHLYEYAIADYDGIAKFYPPDNPDHVSHSIIFRPYTSDKSIEVQVYRLKTILKMLKHNELEILKMDIEGAEYSVLEDILSSDIKIKQILLEFHHNYDNIGILKTKKAIKLLNKKGFKIYNTSPSGEEYSFINEKLFNTQSNKR